MKGSQFGVIILLVGYVSCQRNWEAANSSDAEPSTGIPSNRTARRYGLANSCLTTDGTSGTCMTRLNCMRQGGVIHGYCGSYGICCETNLNCNGVSRLKRTIIQNPTTLTSYCGYTIEAYSPNVCQLLVEFEKFDLEQPSLNADTGLTECGSDYFLIGNFRLCGTNTQQHLYLPFSASDQQITLQFNLLNQWTQTAWNLVVTQLECPASKFRASSLLPFATRNSLNDLRTIFSKHSNDMDLLAPPGCDQYFRQSTGTIQSFNYDESAGTTYLPNMDYVICIKPVPGATIIEYTMQAFSMSTQFEGQNYDEACHTTVQTEGRSEDYLMIPQSLVTSMTYLQATHYCGVFAQNYIIYASPPFIMYFSSDDMVNDVETGFSIAYNVKTTI